MNKIDLWLRRLEKLEKKENLTFESVYTAIGSINSSEDKVTYIQKFSKMDPDYGSTLRNYARREYRRTGDREIEIEWIKAIHKVEAEYELKKVDEKWFK